MNHVLFLLLSTGCSAGAAGPAAIDPPSDEPEDHAPAAQELRNQAPPGPQIDLPDSDGTQAQDLELLRAIQRVALAHAADLPVQGRPTRHKPLSPEDRAALVSHLAETSTPALRRLPPPSGTRGDLPDRLADLAIDMLYTIIAIDPDAPNDKPWMWIAELQYRHKRFLEATHNYLRIVERSQDPAARSFAAESAVFAAEFVVGRISSILLDDDGPEPPTPLPPEFEL